MSGSACHERRDLVNFERVHDQSKNFRLLVKKKERREKKMNEFVYFLYTLPERSMSNNAGTILFFFLLLFLCSTVLEPRFKRNFSAVRV